MEFETILVAQLGKTAVAISDMERGKVQITASDLSILANALNKPIEFFCGNEIGENEIQYLVAVIKKQPPEVWQQTFEQQKCF